MITHPIPFTSISPPLPNIENNTMPGPIIRYFVAYMIIENRVFTVVILTVRPQTRQKSSLTTKSPPPVKLLGSESLSFPLQPCCLWQDPPCLAPCVVCISVSPSHYQRPTNWSSASSTGSPSSCPAHGRPLDLDREISDRS